MLKYVLFFSITFAHLYILNKLKMIFYKKFGELIKILQLLQEFTALKSKLIKKHLLQNWQISFSFIDFTDYLYLYLLLRHNSLLLITLLIMAILITFNMGHITYNDITYSIYKYNITYSFLTTITSKVIIVKVV